MIEHHVGTEELNYTLADYPEKVENCLSVMKENSKKCADIAVESKVEVFIFWEDSSTLNVSPAQIGLIGGLAPVMLLTLSEAELYDYTKKLIGNMDSAGCKRFILANSDSCPVGVDELKFKIVSELIHY